MARKKASPLDSLCKFSIGQYVRHKAHNIKPIKNPDGSPIRTYKEEFTEHRLVIHERLLQECHGGIQVFYKCRLLFSHGGYSIERNAQTGLHSFTEFELMESEPFEISDKRASLHETFREFKKDVKARTRATKKKGK